MTTLSPVSNSGPIPQVQAAAQASDRSTLASDFETFLEMLTVQARYQDPLDPISSSDYAAQLAQFSMVEQQVFTNEQLAAFGSALGGSAITSLANWVGMEARAATSARFDGSPITILPAVAPNADRAQLVIYNDFGSEVGRREIPTTSSAYTWDGRDGTGQLSGRGSYQFSVESFVNGELTASEPAQVYARIVEAQIEGDQTLLKLDSGATVSTSQVTALRKPE